MAKESRKIVIDDNTLFILLALKYQGKLNIQGLQTVYDDDTNYDGTIANPDCRAFDIQKFAEAGLEWIAENTGARAAEIDEVTTISLEDKSRLEEVLSAYLAEFTTSEHYNSREAHRKALYEFIKTTDQYVLEFKDKFFTYRFSQNQKYKNKYKMIEYLAYLMQKGFLEPYSDTPFDFNNDGKEGLKKVIRIGFIGDKALELFEDLIRKDEYQEYIKQNHTEDPIRKGVFEFIGNTVYCISTGRPFKFEGLHLKIVEYCFADNVNSISIEDYKAKIIKDIPVSKKPEDKSIRTYFNQINQTFRRELGIDFDFLASQKSRNGVWDIFTKPL